MLELKNWLETPITRRKMFQGNVIKGDAQVAALPVAVTKFTLALYREKCIFM